MNQRERLSAINIRSFRAGSNLMTNKLFSRITSTVSHNRWLFGAGSRENAGIFLRNDELREWSIARSVGRARIETTPTGGLARRSHADPRRVFFFAFFPAFFFGFGVGTSTVPRHFFAPHQQGQRAFTALVMRSPASMQ